MNWKLLFTLSLFGVAMGIASLFGLTGKLEPVLWLFIFILYAVGIAKRVQSKHFLHGLLVSVFNGLWIGVIHSAFSSTYFENNPDMLEGFQKLPQFVGPQVMMLVMGPLIGAATGVIAGLFTLIAAKMMVKKSAPVDTTSSSNSMS